MAKYSNTEENIEFLINLVIVALILYVSGYLLLYGAAEVCVNLYKKVLPVTTWNVFKPALMFISSKIFAKFIINVGELVKIKFNIGGVEWK